MSPGVVPNYFRTAWRNIYRNPVYSFIAISGLALGFACCFIIVLFLRNELGYDTFHEHSDRIYRVNYTPLFLDDIEFAAIPPPVSPLLTDYFPEIEASARLYRREAVVSRQDAADIQFTESDVYFADSTLAGIFSFDMLRGSIDEALKKPDAIVISDEIAAKYFQDADPVGEILLLEGNHPFSVAGVFRSYPELSHISFDIIGSYEAMFRMEPAAAADNLPGNWVFSHSYTYVLLRQDASADEVNRKFPSFIDNYAPDRFHGSIQFHLVPLRDIYLHSKAYMEPGDVGSITNVYIFSIVAFLVLIVACINFINLSTARSLKRSVEIGVRKVLGASRKYLVVQFIGESVIVSTIAFLFALVLVELLLPFANRLTTVDLMLLSDLDMNMLLMFAGIALVTGIFAGIYPALFLSAFQPIAILKSKGVVSSSRGNTVKRILVAGQFAVTMVLISGAMVVYQQLMFMKNQSMGFERENVLYASLFSDNINNVFTELSPEYLSRLDVYKDEIRNHPGVLGASLVSVPPGLGGTYQNVVPEGYTDEENIFTARMAVSYGFFETTGIELIEGRTFSEEFGTDHESAFIINEYAVGHFGWNTREEAIGKTIRRGEKEGRVVGVVRNFHFESLHTPLGSMVLDVHPSDYNNILIRISGYNRGETYAYLESTWNEYFPDRHFDAVYLESTINEFYKSDVQTALVTRYLSVFTIVISLLGLLGLIMFVVNQKTREIGIRRVLGGTVGDIVLLLSKDMLKLVLLGCVIAIPVSWYWMHSWLENFAYRIQLNPWVFIATAMFIVILALAVLSVQIVRTARINPAVSLRYE